MGGDDSVVSGVRLFCWESRDRLLHGWVFFPEQVVELEAHLSVAGEVGEGLGGWHQQLSQKRGSEDEFGLFLDEADGGHAVWSGRVFPVEYRGRVVRAVCVFCIAPDVLLETCLCSMCPVHQSCADGPRPSLVKIRRERTILAAVIGRGQKRGEKGRKTGTAPIAPPLLTSAQGL